MNAQLNSLKIPQLFNHTQPMPACVNLHSNYHLSNCAFKEFMLSCGDRGTCTLDSPGGHEVPAGRK